MNSVPHKYVIHCRPVPELAYSKAKALLEANCNLSEFGTRRRRSFQAQDIVVQALVRASKEIPSTGGLIGTSNVKWPSRFHGLA